MHILAAVLTFSFLIVFHEYGHMWVARRAGMRVERFSIGFGPVLFRWRRGETEYVISALPLGGYVKVVGMATEDDVDPEDPSNYANKPAWQRLLVILAGPAANYLLAFVVGVGLAMSTISVPDNSAKIGEVVGGKPAALAGMKAGDQVRSVGGIEVHDWDSMAQAIGTAAKGSKGAAIPIVVTRGEQMHTLLVKPTKFPGEGYKIGVVEGVRPAPGVGFGRAIPVSLETMYEQTLGNADLVWKLITRKIGVSVLSGPIGIVSMAVTQAKKGLVDLMELFWQLSIAVGFLNLLPIPGLDGGRLVFLLYEIVARRRMDQRVEGIIHLVGMAGLLLLIVFVSYGDIMRKVHGG